MGKHKNKVVFKVIIKTDGDVLHIIWRVYLQKQITQFF